MSTLPPDSRLSPLLNRLFAEAETATSPALLGISPEERDRLMRSKTEYRELYGKLKDLWLPISPQTGALEQGVTEPVYHAVAEGCRIDRSLNSKVNVPQKSRNHMAIVVSGETRGPSFRDKSSMWKRQVCQQFGDDGFLSDGKAVIVHRRR